MSEALVKTEPAEEDDEENGRTTPVRKSVQEYVEAMNAEVSPNVMSLGVAIKQGTPVKRTLLQDGSVEATMLAEEGNTEAAVAGSTVAQDTTVLKKSNESTTKEIVPPTNGAAGNGVNIAAVVEETATTVSVTNKDTESTTNGPAPATLVASETVSPATGDDRDGATIATDGSTTSNNDCTSSTKLTVQTPCSAEAEYSAVSALVKDEPQDTDLADLERTMARFDGQSIDEMDARSTPRPPPPPISSLSARDQMSTPAPPPPQITTTSSTMDSQQTPCSADEEDSSAGVLVKNEPQDTDLAELEKTLTHLDERDTPPPPPPQISSISASDHMGTPPPSPPVISTTSSTKVTEQTLSSANAVDSTAGVLVKDEPQDTDIEQLENALASLEELDERATPPPPPPPMSFLSSAPNTPPPPPPDISTPPMQRSVVTDTAAQTIPHHLSPDAIGVLVKEETQDKDFAELEDAIAEYKAITNETVGTPPPPPPKISTIPLLRLRVKPEFSAIPQETTVPECLSLPQDFFEGLLTENILARPMIRPKDEPIPDNFFDDLLVDKLQERIEEAETQDLEVKYGDRLKQLKELEQLQHSKDRDKKKHKKSKKKSRKHLRSRSRSPSPSRRRGSRSPPMSRRRGSRSPTTSRRRGSRSPATSRRRGSRSPATSRRRGSRSHTPEQLKHKLMRWPEKSMYDDRMELPTTSKRKRSHKDDDIRDDELRAKLIIKHERRTEENVSPKKADDKLQKRRPPVTDIEILDETIHEDMQPHLPELREDFTPKQKRDRIILRAKALKTYLNVMEMEKDKPLSTFLYTSTVRKLPPSHSYRNQHIYENRSPLHNINNVSYKFNSHARRFNLEEWGLASLPPLASNMAKLVGYDAQAIYNKLKVIKIPAKIRKIKREDGQEDDEDDDDELCQGRSSLFCNASTQTDEAVDIIKRKPKGYDIGVQAVQPAFEIACQTLETESPSIRPYDNNDDLPIMTIMREMNDNQLMALHDFAELLKEPASNAMDMYRLRQRMLDIYKCAQLPSALEEQAPPPPSLNNYTSNEASLVSRCGGPHSEEVAAFRINSVEGGDGSYFSVNDPRVNFIGQRNRDVDADIRNVNPYDPRISHSRPESRWQHNETKLNQRQTPSQRNQPPSNGPKYYGRGALRR